MSWQFYAASRYPSTRFPSKKDSVGALLQLNYFFLNIISERRIARTVWWRNVRVGRWLRRGLWALLVVIGIAVILGFVTFLWLRYVPPPSLPQSSLLAPVNEVHATAGRGIISIAWTPIPNAVCYQVLRSNHPDGPFVFASSVFGAAPIFVEHAVERIFPGEPFGRVPRGPWVDSDIQPGHTYYYRVRANDGSAWSPVGATVAVAAASLTSQEPELQIRVDASHSIGPLEHKWEIALGSEHLSYIFKGDLNEHVKAAGAGLRAGNKLAHDTLGIQYIRAHGILMDDPSVYTEDAAGNPHYDFTKVDKLYDMLRSDGMRPFVELSFMPAALAANPSARKIFKYQASSSPPKDYRKWQALVAALAQHLIDRYGREEVESWPFEVWNEPDLRGTPVFWSGSRDDYFRLYDYAAEGLKSVDPNLKVGGPVAAFTTFQEPFLRHVTTQNFATGGHSVPLDFLDMHTYYLPASDYRPLLRRYGLGNLPIYFSEWGISPEYGDKVSDTAYSAAATVSGIDDSLDQVTSISYWTASDYFEESGDPKALFHGGFGLIGLEGLRKPRYWAYYLLHQLGTDQPARDRFGRRIWRPRQNPRREEIRRQHRNPSQQFHTAAQQSRGKRTARSPRNAYHLWPHAWGVIQPRTRPHRQRPLQCLWSLAGNG